MDASKQNSLLSGFDDVQDVEVPLSDRQPSPLPSPNREQLENYYAMDESKRAALLSGFDDVDESLAASARQGPLDRVREIRRKCRYGELTSTTAGLAPGFAQANLVILPQSASLEFLVFCQRNPKPCPVLDVTDAGSACPLLMATPGSNVDLRTDLPRYRIWRKGELVDEVTDATQAWTEYHKIKPDDPLVCFLLGCSFAFEDALCRAGIELRHQQEKRVVPMYKTNVKCTPSGRFTGHLVVSMRPMPIRDAIKAVEVSGRYPGVHGAPVHIGAPGELGIRDLATPDFGEAVTIRANEVPVFWACGVTPQTVAAESKVDFMITHHPGSMFVCDVKSDEL